MSAVLRPSEPPAPRAKHLGLLPLEKIKETVRTARLRSDHFTRQSPRS